MFDLALTILTTALASWLIGKVFPGAVSHCGADDGQLFKPGMDERAHGELRLISAVMTRTSWCALAWPCPRIWSRVLAAPALLHCGRFDWPEQAHL